MTAPRRTHASLAVIASLVTAAVAMMACGGASSELSDSEIGADREPDPHTPHADYDRTETESFEPRALPATATYGDLVTAARRLDERSTGDSDAGCLLRGDGVGAFRLEGDIAVAIRPLPEPPLDLDARLSAEPGAVVLSRWGPIGAVDAPRTIALVTWTTTPPVRADAAVAIVLTDRGAYVRPVGTGAGAASGPVPAAEAAEVAMASGDLPLVVAAEAGVSLGELRALLQALGEGATGRLAFAVTLAPDTRLPSTAAGRDVQTGLCPDGLPPATGPAGDLAAEALMSAVAPLRDASAQCLVTAAGPAAAGGTLRVVIRVGADGAVEDTCIRADDTADGALRACVLEAVRGLSFPAPSPAGSIDAELPLRLVPDGSLAQRPLCAADR